MDEINNFFQRRNKKIINIQVMKDFDTKVTGVNYSHYLKKLLNFRFDSSLSTNSREGLNFLIDTES
jgi:hypothetical protein